MIRSSSCGSLVTILPPALKRSCRPASSACPAKLICSRRNRSRIGNDWTCGSTAPASSLEISRIAPNEASSASIDRIMLWMSGRSIECAIRRSRVAPKKLRACSGWRRSWLAEARNWLFSLLVWAVSSICWCRRWTRAPFSNSARRVERKRCAGPARGAG